MMMKTVEKQLLPCGTDHVKLYKLCMKTRVYSSAEQNNIYFRIIKI